MIQIKYSKEQNMEKNPTYKQTCNLDKEYQSNIQPANLQLRFYACIE